MATSVNPKVMIAISKQINEMIKKKTDGFKIQSIIQNLFKGITVIPNQRDILDIQADITGPVDTPYENGVFRCKLVLDSTFPSAPPKGYFLTKIFHPNVSSKGDICVNTLKKDWKPTSWSLQNIFQVIRCLLIIPFPESALNEEAGKMFMENYDEYGKYAKLITQLHAMPKNVMEQPLIKKSFSTMEQYQPNNQKFKNTPKRLNTISMNINQQSNQLDGVKENIQNNALVCSSNLSNCGGGDSKFFLENQLNMQEHFIESPVKMETENTYIDKQNSNSKSIKNFQLEQLIDNTFEQPVFMYSNQNQNLCNLFANSVNLTKKENDKKKWMRRI